MVQNIAGQCEYSVPLIFEKRYLGLDAVELRLKVYELEQIATTKETGTVCYHALQTLFEPSVPPAPHL